MMGLVLTNALVAVLIVAFKTGNYEAGYWIWGMIISGSILNRLVVGMNGDSMPVWARNDEHAKYISESSPPSHSVATKESKMMLLADIIPIPFVGMASIGDLIIFAGCGYAAYFAYTLN